MKQQNVRDRLIDSAVKIIAENGLDKTTTKAIVSGTDINEAYIYTYFEGKEDLISKAFDSLNAGFAEEIDRRLPILGMTDIDFEIRPRMFFEAIWEFMIKNRDNCIAYVRYYYSPYFLKYSVASHKERYVSIIEKFKSVFIDEADMWMIMSHILNVMLDFAIKVHYGQMSN